MNQKKKAGIMLVAFAAVIIGIAAASLAKGREEPQEEPQNVYHDVPDGDVAELSASKTDAYRTYSGTGNIEDYWNDCEDDFEDIIDEQKAEPSRSPSGGVTAEDLFGSATQQSTPATRTGGTPAPHRETAREREERHQKRREEAVELASDIQKRQMGAEETAEADSPATVIVPETIELTSAGSTVRRSGVISSLDDSWTDGGISSLDDPSAAASGDDRHPFKCMFVREEKIKTGQRVSVRLLEDMVIGNVLVPKNSHLMASCSIGNRLELEISNIEMQGRILSLGYEAYDTDGTKGIYCPDAADNVAQTARSRGTGLAGTALRSRVGRVAGDVISTGISLIENSNGERTVTVPAGYTFFIVRKKNP